MNETETNNEKTIRKVQINDVFYTSWGYDQTNINFIQVVSISPTGKTVICKRCIKEQVKNDTTYNLVKPTFKTFGKSFRMKVEQNDKPSLRGNYIFCGDEESEHKRYDYFRLHENDKTYYETDSMFGH